MRLVIDMQGAQTESRFRGIGRYSLSLAQAIARKCGKHEVILALNAHFPETIDPIRVAFEGLIPQKNIRVWCAPGPIRETDPSNHFRREIAERMREAFLVDLKPDVVLITSLVEGLGDDAVTSIGIFDTIVPTAVILYDLIPLINPDIHFKTNKIYQDWYSRKIASLKRSRLLLAISNSSKSEAQEVLDFDADDVVNIFGACDAVFRNLNLSEDEKWQVCSKAGISRPFIMYTGGADERKNLQRLIEAYASIPKVLRKQYQLVFVGKMPEGNVRGYFDAARNLGLVSDEIICTGYVEEEDLVNLYNSCTLFVFPSTHEGLGLPPMEAMSCGAPVLCSNATSLPEVVTWEEALFDSTSVRSIACKIEQALSDETFRQKLSEYGHLRSSEFSWDKSAEQALQALSRFDRITTENQSSLCVERTSLFAKRQKKILLFKLDHMGDFILAVPAITKLKAKYPYAKLDIVVGSWNLSFAKALKIFDNIYVLDYFRKVSAESPSITDTEIDVLIKRLSNYEIAIDLRRQSDTRFILIKVEASLKVGYETFNPNLDSRLDLKIKAYPDVPFEKTPLNKIHISKQMLELVDVLPVDINDYVFFPEMTKRVQTGRIEVAMFPTAGNDVRQWPGDNYVALASLLADDERVDAVDIYFGSEEEASRYEFQPNQKLRRYCGLDFHDLVESLSKNSICIANNSFGAHIASYSGCLVIGIYGGQETMSEWAPVFGESYAIHCQAFCSPCHISKQSDCRNGMFCLTAISVKAVYDKINEAITSQKQGKTNNQVGVILPSSVRTSSQLVDNLVDAIAAIFPSALDGNQGTLIAANIAANIACNHRLESSKKQFLIDVSELVQRDAKSGIQRVVRAVLTELLHNPPEGFVVEPVYGAPDKPGYRYARSFTNILFNNSQTIGEDMPVEAWPGDIFLGLDLQPQIVQVQEELLKAWRQRGVGVYFVVYDLLPVLLPHAFPEGAELAHHKWLETISHFDGAIAISKTVADELNNWLQVFGQQRRRPLHIGWFHLGANVECNSPTTGIPLTAPDELVAIAARPSFLMVGTVEPRKRYDLALAAFDLLWQAGEEINLVIVGKKGWAVDTLIDRLHGHSALGEYLFWFDDISDDYLKKIYDASTCLIAASDGEGFGLPLIEAAQQNLPIIARDIPIFREVAANHAFYFSGIDGQSLAVAVKDWLRVNKSGKAPQSGLMPRLTWAQSSQQLIDVILNDKWTTSWKADGVHRYFGSDRRLFSSVGKKDGLILQTTGTAGCLLFGPYVSLSAGRYQVKLHGHVECLGTPSAYADIALQNGAKVVVAHALAVLPNVDVVVEMEVFLKADVNDLEVRVYVAADSDLSISKLEIFPISFSSRNVTD